MTIQFLLATLVIKQLHVTCKTLDSILEDNKVLTAFDFISVDNREVS